MQTTEKQPVISTEEAASNIDFGLIFFSSNEASDEREKYRLVLESAKFADRHGLSSIWIPERHFTQEGRLYPNPAILHAALATQTQRIQLRAGSVVLPLHNPIQVAEEWAMIDNLSGGRVGISFASGWHPTDFVLRPDNYAQRNETMYAGIDIVRKLWRGETIQSRAGNGEMTQIRTYPAPIQRELPIWITAAGNPKTFAAAGEIGANLLTYMYNQSIEELAEKIHIYRNARAQHGYDPVAGQVSVMLHTFVGPDEELVRKQLQGPFCAYLRSATHLLDALAYSRGQKVDLSTLSSQELDDYLFFVFEHLISNRRVLFGTPQSCLNLVMQLRACGVNEIACQMDFGVETNLVLDSLPYLTRLQEQVNTHTRTFNQEQILHLHESNLPLEQQRHTILTQTPAHTVQESSISELALIQQRCRQYLAPTKLYQQLEQQGVQLSGSYRGISDIWFTTDEALGSINISAQDDKINTPYQLPATLFDTCCLLLLAALPSERRHPANYLPCGMNDLYIHQSAPGHLWSHAQLITPLMSENEQTIIGNVTLYTDDGTCIAEICGLQLQRLTPDIILDTLEQLIPQSVDRIGVMKMDWTFLTQSFPHLATLPLISNLINSQRDTLFESVTEQKQLLTTSLFEQVLAASPQQRQLLVADHLSHQITTVLQLSPNQLDREASLAALGLDSLLAFELKHQLDFQFAIHIPVVTLLQGPSITQLTTYILTQLAEKEHIAPSTITISPGATERDTSTTQQLPEDLVHQLDQRAPQHVVKLVQNLLSTTQQPAIEQSIKQQQVPQLDQLTDEQVELLLQQIARGGDTHDNAR